MPTVPAFLLKKLYVKGSLKATTGGSGLTIRNTLAPGTITRISPFVIDGEEITVDRIRIGRGSALKPASRITARTPFEFRLNDTADVWIDGLILQPGRHALTVTITAKEVGELRIEIEDQV